MVASWESGQVLDFEVLSKYCPECAAHDKLDKDTQDYKDWLEAHKASCDANYVGCSPAMEAEGALRIWRRSVEKLKLRYTTMITDGDANTAKLLNDSKPYGEEVKIVKHECVGHVQKRL